MLFRPVTFMQCVGDWMRDREQALTVVRDTEASAERWFQFEMAGLLLEHWDKVTDLKWKKNWVWIEEPIPGGQVDLALGPRDPKTHRVRWSRSLALELKHLRLTERGCGDLRQVREDLDKRRASADPPKLTLGLTLCNHPWTLENERTDDAVLDDLERIRAAGEMYDLRPVGGSLRWRRTYLRGQHRGVVSVALWADDPNGYLHQSD